MSSGGADHLNGWSSFVIGVFAVVSFCVLCPVYIPLPFFISRPLHKLAVYLRILDAESTCDTKRWYLPLTLETTPVIGVVLLLATTAIPGSVVRVGIVGEAGARPYDVLVLFISLAYIAVSLDSSGALRALALYVAEHGGKSSMRLYFYLYAFFFTCSIIAGNDPVILSGTPFLAYFADTSLGGAVPHPWVFAQFFAANTASSVLVSSNPTNVLLAGAFEMNYLTDFTKFMILPSVVSAIVSYPLFLVIFKQKFPKSLPKDLQPPQENPKEALLHPKRAIFLFTLFIVTIGVLVGTSFVPGGKVEVWMVTMPAGVIALIADLCFDYFDTLQSRKQACTNKEAEANASEKQTSHNSHTQPPDLPPSNVLLMERKSNTDKIREKAVRSRLTLPYVWRTFAKRFPTTARVIPRLPIPLLPFAIGMFILVRALEYTGWVHVIARGFARVCTSPAQSVFFIGFVMAVAFCPFVGTNIGSSILIVEILRSPSFAQSAPALADPKILKGAVYAAIWASNVGAYSLTFAASLAGLLWRNLLQQKNYTITTREFATYNFVPLIVQTTLGCAIILGELDWHWSYRV